MGHAEKSSLKVEEQHCSMWLLEADTHSLKININYIGEHRTASQEAALSFAHPFIENTFQLNPVRASDQPVVGIDDGERTRCGCRKYGPVNRVVTGYLFWQAAQNSMVETSRRGTKLGTILKIFCGLMLNRRRHMCLTFYKPCKVSHLGLDLSHDNVEATLAHVPP